MTCIYTYYEEEGKQAHSAYRHKEMHFPLVRSSYIAQDIERVLNQCMGLNIQWVHVANPFTTMLATDWTLT